MVRKIIVKSHGVGIRVDRPSRNSSAIEEDVLLLWRASQITLVQDGATCISPVERSRSGGCARSGQRIVMRVDTFRAFFHAHAISIVDVRHPGRRDETILGIV